MAMGILSMVLEWVCKFYIKFYVYPYEWYVARLASGMRDWDAPEDAGHPVQILPPVSR